MARRLLINKADFATYNVVQLPTNFNFDRSLKNMAWLAMDTWLRPRLGAAFMSELEAYSASPANPVYDNVLEPTTYTYGTYTYTHNGLKEALCRYAYSMYLLDSAGFETQFGTVVKDGDSSQPMDRKMIAERKEIYRQSAESLFNDVLLFLDRNTTIYTNYAARSTSYRLRRIRKIDNQQY